MSSYIDFIIQADELNKLLKSTQEIVIIDIRLKEEYEKGHIDTAINFPEVFNYLPKDITNKKEQEAFINFYENLFSNAGISGSEIVVFYKNNFTLKPPLGLSILKYLGYDEKKIKVLDSGYIYWKERGFKTSKITTCKMQKKFISKIDENFLLDYNEILSYTDNSNDKNELLQENIALKNKLDSLYSKNANLINFPKYNKEPIFAFDRCGNISFENKPKKIKLPNIVKIFDIFPDFQIEDISNMIDNQEKKSKTIQKKDKYYLLNCIGSRDSNNILVYGFETTLRENLNKSLSSQYELVQNIINTVPIRIFWKDRECRFLGANNLFLEDTGFKNISEIIGKTDFDMPWDKTEAQNFRDDDLKVMNSGIDKINFEESQTQENGETIVLLTSKVPLRDGNHNIIGVLGSYADITHQREMEIAIKKQKDILIYQAHHDSLTGLPNRILFHDRLSLSIQTSKRNKTKTALLFIDLDHFKEINDSLGHDIGDKVLKIVSNRLKKVVRAEDTVSRLGGDEFTIILGELSEVQDSSK